MLCYSSYSSGPEGWALFMILLFIAWGVLNIILFFKIWKACNDVKKIASNFSGANSPLIWSDYLIFDKKEEAVKNVIHQLLSNLNKVYYGYMTTQPQYYDKEIEEAKRRLEIIGMGELPEQLSSIENFLNWKKSTDKKLFALS